MSALIASAGVTPLAVSLDPNSVSPGLLGFIVVCIIGVATWFLFRNMAKHLSRHAQVREDEEPGTAPGPRV